MRQTVNVTEEKRVTGRLRGIVCACSHGVRGTVGLNLTQIRQKTDQYERVGVLCG